MRLVRQEDALGCAIACCAMLTGMSYYDARRFFPPGSGSQKPAGGYEEHQFLVSQGWEVVGTHWYTPWGGKPRPDVWPPEPFAEVHIASVKVREDHSLAHAVVLLADGTVLDPDRERPGRLSDYLDVYGIEGWRRRDADGPGRDSERGVQT